MLLNLAKNLFGNRNDRVVKKMDRLVDAINAHEEAIAALSDAELRAKTDDFKTRLTEGETVDDLLIEAFATVREAAKRSLGMRHFDVQLKGGIVLHRGQVAEMKTGEGKTLVGTLPVYLNALAGKGVHVVTVNDYLAKRDAEWMAPVYEFLGLTVGYIQHDMSEEDRRKAYNSDITFATNNEIGFDYLRDNMKYRTEDLVLRPFHYAIIDEVDSILIDEARTPLIISGPAEDSSELYLKMNEIMPNITPDDYDKDEKFKTVNLTESGVEKIEALLRDAGLMTVGSLYDLENLSLLQHAQMSLRAHVIFTRDKDYIVKNDKIILIDEFTGRMTPGRRYGEGQHQAIEAKEGVTIQQENQTLASISFQNLFRLYPKLGGMTGTALTEATELMEIYGLDTVAIPTNVPITRKDHDDIVFRTAQEKFDAIITLVRECQEREQPVLVGTTSIEKSEELSAIFKKAKIKHEVLNARQHEREAFIVAQAGRRGAVTIATNMAGRGTDIKLGGNVEMRVEELRKGNETPEQIAKLTEKVTAEVAKDAKTVKDAGGLYIVGTERHESRRIDNQLRGRSGRQGDAGASQFYLSLEDDLMRIFGAEQRIGPLLDKLNVPEGFPIVHPWITTAVERAQKRIEGHHYDTRKNLLKFDNVMNDQRKVVYEQRREMMSAEDVAETVLDMREDTVHDLTQSAIPAGAYREQWNLEGLAQDVETVLGQKLPIIDWANEEGTDEAVMADRILEACDQKRDRNIKLAGNETYREIERSILLQIFDQEWKEHLLMLDHLRQGIQLRAYGQRDPLNEYKTEAFQLFQGLMSRIRLQATRQLCHIDIAAQQAAMAQLRELEKLQQAATERAAKLRAQQPDANQAGSPLQMAPPPAHLRGNDGGKKGQGAVRMTPVRRVKVDPENPETWGQTPRNAPCPCGSGNKYKHCHGKLG